MTQNATDEMGCEQEEFGRSIGNGSFDSEVSATFSVCCRMSYPIVKRPGSLASTVVRCPLYVEQALRGRSSGISRATFRGAEPRKIHSCHTLLMFPRYFFAFKSRLPPQFSLQKLTLRLLPKIFPKLNLPPPLLRLPLLPGVASAFFVLNEAGLPTSSPLTSASSPCTAAATLPFMLLATSEFSPEIPASMGGAGSVIFLWSRRRKSLQIIYDNGHGGRGKSRHIRLGGSNDGGMRQKTLNEICGRFRHIRLYLVATFQRRPDC